MHILTFKRLPIFEFAELRRYYGNLFVRSPSTDKVQHDPSQKDMVPIPSKILKETNPERPSTPDFNRDIENYSYTKLRRPFPPITKSTMNRPKRKISRTKTIDDIIEDSNSNSYIAAVL
jgi:hypothetical protein